MRQLFLDCDGVLADFDSAARGLFGRDSREAEDALGTREFWNRIRHSREFYRHLALMPDAMTLYEAVEHLDPIILTGCPFGGWAEEQKIEWAAQHFPGVRMITCRSKDKFLHMKHPGDILVDDYLKYKDLWEQSGGIFVHHRSAGETIQRLSELALDVEQPVESKVSIDSDKLSVNYE